MITHPSDPAPSHLSEESGFTLVEMMVALAILGIVMGVFLTMLASVQTSLVRETNRSTTMDQARLAVEAIDREVRSASILCVSTTGSPAVYMMTMYSRSSYSTNDSTTMRWIRYRLSTQAQTLERQQSISTGPTLSSATWPSSWRTVATGLVNSASPFSLPTSSMYLTTTSSGASLPRLLNLTLLVNSKTSDTSSSSTTLQSSIAIRNLDPSLSC